MTFKNDEEKLSYALGMVVATNLTKQGFENLQAEFLAKGMVDSSAGSDVMTVELADTYIQEYMNKKQAEKHAGAKDAGIAFLAKNRLKDGVTTTASGLQYQVLKDGNGDSPKATDKVTVHYHGTLIDGTVFDSSVKRNQPASFGLNQVIPGWTEGVQLMKVGAKYRFFIPSELGYGAQGAGGSIPPFSTLIFEVELLRIG